MFSGQSFVTMPLRPLGERKTAAATRHEVPVNAVSPTVMPPAPEYADLLDEVRSGRREALDRITALVYNELREIAHRHRMARKEDGTLATTALVHEAYLKLVDQSRARWNDRAHFLALAAVAMRHILADRARFRQAAKRGGKQAAITLDEAAVASDDEPGALLQVDEALGRLEQVDGRLARVVEYRFFGGMTNAEIAESLGVTIRTVERDWVKARMLLRHDLKS